jgi:thiaminase/transcriptional activator TenA
MTRSGWTGKLWAEVEGTYAAITDHPFITGLTSGTLEPGKFLYFISQDAHYIREFAKAITILGIRAPTAEASEVLARHAAAGYTAESALHATLAGDLGADPASLTTVQASPTTQGYTSYVLAAALAGDFAEGFASVLPCVWIYAEVGRHLQKLGSPHPVYQRWIDNYAAPDYHSEAAEALDLADRLGAGLTGIQEARARERFAAAARYEWMFWDAAWRREAWPI